MIQANKDVSDAYRVGFKAGFDECLKIIKEAHNVIAEDVVFDSTTVAAYGITLQALREHVDKNGEVNFGE